MVTTKTIGPLHLEDLEPHRFEDLVRQLLYDFRPWRMLEATGRSGSDDGFDARGTENLDPPDRSPISPDDDEVDEPAPSAERIWLIQCKREKTITPKKLEGYLNDIPEDERARLHGIIFAAACDFSKAARDLFRNKGRELGFAEAYLWGRGELEDMLFQPKNDHLLFAYIGISLQVRKRTLKTQVRSRLAMKRKALRTLQEQQPVLIRDATDDRYPYRDPDESKSGIERGRWRVMNYVGAFSDGLHFIVQRHFAYLSEDGNEWDYAEAMDDGPVHQHYNPWNDRDQDEESLGRTAAWNSWEALPESTRAWYEVIAILPYDNILDVDEKGDEHCEQPHIYTSEFDTRDGPFCYFLETLETIAQGNRRAGDPNPERRVEKFSRRAMMQE